MSRPHVAWLKTPLFTTLRQMTCGTSVTTVISLFDSHSSPITSCASGQPSVVASSSPSEKWNYSHNILLTSLRRPPMVRWHISVPSSVKYMAWYVWSMVMEASSWTVLASAPGKSCPAEKWRTCSSWMGELWGLPYRYREKKDVSSWLTNTVAATYWLDDKASCSFSNSSSTSYMWSACYQRGHSQKSWVMWEVLLCNGSLSQHFLHKHDSPLQGPVQNWRQNAHASDSVNSFLAWTIPRQMEHALWWPCKEKSHSRGQWQIEDFFACLGFVLIPKYEAHRESETQNKCSTSSHAY